MGRKMVWIFIVWLGGIIIVVFMGGLFLLE